MAVPSNTVLTYSVTGNREDLAEAIFDISPLDTPFLSEASKNSAKAVYHEWQTDSLDSHGANAHLEGDDATANTLSPTTRVGNYCQISRKTVQVSGTQRSVDSAGRSDEYSYQIAKRGREIKRDMEFTLTQNQAAYAGSASTARTLGSLESWLSTNYVSEGTGTAQTVPGASSGTPTTAPTDSTIAGTFEKASLDTAIQNCWTQGGDPKIIMVGPFNRTKISGFSGISTLQTDAQAGSDVTLMGAIDFYKSNFGTLKVVPNRFQRDEVAFVLDMEYLGVSMLRNMEIEPLAKTGDSDKALLIAEYTLEVKNEAASAQVRDLTTS